MKFPFYWTYGLVVLTLAGWSQYRGWTLTKVSEVRNVPRSVRDNPGAYRSHYSYPRYFGGK